MSIIVLGDVITHQHLFSVGGSLPTLRLLEEGGGAKALEGFLKTRLPEAEVRLLTDQASHKALWLWEPRPSSEARGRYLAQFLGYVPEACVPAKLSTQALQGAELLVLYDEALGFRLAKSCWEGLFEAAPQKVLLRTKAPLSQGELWPYVREHWAERLTIVLSAEDLRQEGGLVTKDRSWENTLQDLLREFFTNPFFAELKRARNVVIQLDTEGALWINNPGEAEPKISLIFDAGSLEGQWASSLPGTIPEGDLPFLASVAQALLSGQEANPGAHLKRGLAEWRARLFLGRLEEGQVDQEALDKLVQHHKKIYGQEELPPLIYEKGPHWSLLAHKSGARKAPLYGRAREIALDGLQSLRGFPYGRFGLLVSVDRREIESLNSIKRLIEHYVRFGSAERPLNLAVFGPPGAGKSFGIKQIAKGILGKEAAILEFNLSQLKGPEELAACFHQVRDQALRGKVPLVFWDEFDSRNLFWLQYFLAPMQDGCFLEGQVQHPLGQGIFVFAGGTSYTFESFVPQEGTPEFEAFKQKKGPDFVSRLRGYLNVLGPNRRLVKDEATGKLVSDPEDLFFPIRRALILRAILRLRDDEPLDIDRPLLNALLKISRYKHGARSLESIVQLTVQGGKELRCANLPPREQLELHVDYEEFIRLMHEDFEFQKKCEELAPAIHEYYLDLAKKEGWKVKYDQPWEELPPDIKADNLAAARRISRVLGLVGLKVVRAEDPGRALTPEEIRQIIMENARFLAEEEHKGWMEAKLQSGWRYAPQRDDEKKLHPCLRPFEELPEEEQKKDLHTVLNYPAIVARAGFKIILEE